MWEYKDVNWDIIPIVWAEMHNKYIQGLKLLQNPRFLATLVALHFTPVSE